MKTTRVLLLLAAAIVVSVPVLIAPAQGENPGEAAAPAVAEHHAPPPADPNADGELAVVIPAGQEELFADILGRGETLPGGCKLSDGAIGGVAVLATYDCVAGKIVFELTHRDRGARGSTQTGQFAISAKSGTPPDGFAAALESRVRAKEAAMKWTWLGAPGSSGGTSRNRSIGLLGAAGVVLIAAIILGARKLRSR